LTPERICKNGCWMLILALTFRGMFIILKTKVINM
jgi:hypothetical protein